MEHICVYRASSDELQHYGVVGMKWGVVRTPEQLGHKPQGGKDYKAKRGVDPNIKEKKARGTFGKVVVKVKGVTKASMEKHKERKQARQERRQIKAEAKKAAQKKKWLKDPDQLIKHKDEFTTQEIRQALDRYDAEDRLSAAAQFRKDAGIRAVNKAIDVVNTGARAVDSVGKFYDNTAKLFNTFYGEGFLPRYGGGNGNKNNNNNNQQNQNRNQNNQPNPYSNPNPTYNNRPNPYAGSNNNNSNNNGNPNPNPRRRRNP